MITRDEFISLTDLVGIEVVRLDALLMNAERQGRDESKEEVRRLEWELNRLKDRGAG